MIHTLMNEAQDNAYHEALNLVIERAFTAVEGSIPEVVKISLDTWKRIIGCYHAHTDKDNPNEPWFQRRIIARTCQALPLNLDADDVDFVFAVEALVRWMIKRKANAESAAQNEALDAINYLVFILAADLEKQSCKDGTGRWQRKD